MRLADATTPEQAAMYVHDLVTECVESTRRVDWEDKVDGWLQSYIGESDQFIHKIYDETSGRYDSLPHQTATQRRVTLNRIQNCVISMAAIQASDPPRITFTPRENGEPALVYLDTNIPEGAALAMQYAATGIDPTQPLPDEIAKVIKQQIQIGESMQMQAAMMGQPPPVGLLPKETIVEVTDSTTSEWLQTIHDGMAEAADLLFYFAENTLNKNILGWQPTRFKFNQFTKEIEYCNVNSKHVFIDPLSTNPRRANYIVWDEILASDDAVAQYPEDTEAIDNASGQTVQYPAGKTYTASDVYGQNFRREMVLVRHAWVRNQPYPMTPEQAIESGGVEATTLETGFTTQSIDPTGFPVDVPETREAMMVDGAEVTEGAPNWPMRYGIRYLVVIGNVAVLDEECAYSDIPVAVNINIPIPYSPYGQGEPERLTGLQDALNRVVSAICTNFDYTAYPPEAMWEAVYNRISEELRDIRTRPDKRLVVPDDLRESVGGDISKIIATLPVPTMPAEVWKLVEFLMTAIDKEGNQAEVLQGNASGNWSGQAISNLQSAAAQVIKFKSGRTEFYLKHLAELATEAITKFMTPDDCRRYSSKFPDAVHQAFFSRAKQLHMDVSVQVSSGSGAAKQAETNNLVAARGAGIIIPDEIILERMDIDPDVVRQKKLEAAREQSQLAQLQPMTGQGQESTPATAQGQAEPTA